MASNDDNSTEKVLTLASNDDNSAKKVLTLTEVQQLAEDKNKCILIINDHVYDVTKFIDVVSHQLFINQKQ